MRGAKSLPAVVLVVMLIVSASYATLAPAGSHGASLSGASKAAPLTSGITSIGQTTSTEFLTHTLVAINTTVWKGDTSPQTTVFNYATELQYPTALILPPSYTGYTLFEPNSTLVANATANVSIPAPTHVDAWGWLSGLQQIPGSMTIPAGVWTFNIGLNITSPAGASSSGTLYMGVSAYTYDSAGKPPTFTPLFHAENTSFSLGGSAAISGNHLVHIAATAPSITFSASESLFTEFYLNASSFTPSTALKVDFQIGGSNASQYNFTYPDYGWISGKVTPASAPVTVAGFAIQTNSTGEFNITAAPMLYTVQASSPGYANFSERIDVSSGAATIVDINLSKLYSVKFGEQGLPAGTTWYVNLTNGQSFNSTSATISFNETNGTYTYSVASSNKLYGAGGGSFAVNGTNVSRSITFAQSTYLISLTETGLPAGTTWYVNLTNGQSFNSASATISFNETNGSYLYSIGSANTSYSSSGGSFTVNGANVSKSIAFSLVIYRATFTETGLPAGITWYVNVTGGGTYSSSTSTISTNLANGSYLYSIGSANTSYSSSGGSFTVNGANVSKSIAFSLVIYSVTFDESGLASGSNWSITVNGATHTTNGQSMTLRLPNGTYTYVPGQVSGFKLNSTDASFKVAGSGLNLTVIYTPVSGGGGGLISSGTWFFIIVLLALIALEAAVGVMYFRRRREERSRNEMTGEESEGALKGGSALTVTQMLSTKKRPGKTSDPNYKAASRSRSRDGPAEKESDAAKDFEIEGGNSYAVFEQTAQGSMKLFESGISKGYKGLCFTRQYPEKMRQRFATESATVMWLSNLGNENSIRPKDLEKITLLCNETLSSGRSIILIDGLEYLITNNGFITVLKMLQFLRDATAVNDSILVISINPNAIGENEVNLIMREVDRVIR